MTEKGMEPIVKPGIKPEIKWFKDAGFGMFVHFGIYALLEKGEWVMYRSNIPRDEYEKLADRFNPSKFDADSWVGLAQDAGARYMTVTAKHHDGFCLFDSKLTEFKITNTSFKRDLIGELVSSCQRLKMPIILYYSQPDWHHPNYVHNKGAFKDLANPPATDKPDWPLYQEYLAGQVEELCANYGKIDGIWFDGSHKTEEEWRGKLLYKIIKKYNPGAVVNDRARCGDFFTPERSLPEDLTGYIFEACQSVMPSAWGYKGEDASLYSVPHLVKSLLKMTGAGGNYLLNVGPAHDGSMPDNQAEVMRSIGKWLKECGESVYKTEPALIDLPREKFAAVRKGNDLYLHLLEWPEENRITIPGLEDIPKSISLSEEEGDPGFEMTEEGLEIRNLPCMPGGPLPRVIKIEFEEAPRLQNERRETSFEKMTALEEGVNELKADEAELTGRGVKGHTLKINISEDGKTSWIEGWQVPQQAAVWKLEAEKEGAYRLSAFVRMHGEPCGARIRIDAGGQTLYADIPETGDDFREVEFGEVMIPAGVMQIELSPAKLKWGYVFCVVEKIIMRGHRK